MSLSDKKSLTEEEIKQRYISPALAARWDQNLIRMEYYFTDGRIMINGRQTRRGRRKFADYILNYRPNLPLAIVEAKDNTHPPGAGLQQAMEYAEILDVPFAYSSNGDSFIEFDRASGQTRELALSEFPSPAGLWARYSRSRNFTPAGEKVIVQPWHYQIGDKTPRYYQRIAVNRTIEAISQGQQRILIAMATGTGKTYTAFQIAWRLWKSGLKRKILYLADRNILVDQAMQQDFRPFRHSMHKIQGRHLDSAFELYFSLYHQLAGEEGAEPFREFRPEFFDLVIIDECHRGSAREESNWRRILDYFSGATHIGMTATPKETRDTSNTTYFGRPAYTYSLRQGIEDGFLAPYRVVRVGLDRDLEGWRPEYGKLDKAGVPVQDREYTIRDYDRNLVIDERTEAVAEKITLFLKASDRYAKTIVFCVDTEHADRMRTALARKNADMMKENPGYVTRITHDEAGRDRDLEDFMAVDTTCPVIVTTSELLSTGVDCKTCKLIVLDKDIGSDIEFKQIIGRGTRLRPDYGKEYFTIMDFRGVTRMFANDDFWVIPEPDENFGTGSGEGHEKREKPEESTPREKTYVNGVAVEIISERVQYIGADGRLITESIADYSKRNILGEYARLDDFLGAWNSGLRKQAILDELQERGVLLDVLREEAGNSELDDFDLICHLAWDRRPLTRAERARKVKEGGYLDRYEGVARDVLAALLDKYARFGIRELEDANIFSIQPFLSMGGGPKIAKLFGGRDGLFQALDELHREIYRVA